MGWYNKNKPDPTPEPKPEPKQDPTQGASPEPAPSQGEQPRAAKPDEPPREWDLSDAGPDIVQGTETEAEAKLANLQMELADAQQRYLRTLADFQNYQRRAIQNEDAARHSGVSMVVAKVVGVIDHFDLALNQDPAKASAQSILDGVVVIRSELLKALQQCGVRLISPAPNDPFTPGTHEAIMQMPAEGVEPGNVARTFQPGYALGERVIRPAKVAVAP